VALAAVVAGGAGWVLLDRPRPGPQPALADRRTGTVPTQTVARGPADPPTVGTAVPAAPRSVADWWRVLTALDARREEAFARGDAGVLDDVYPAGSAPLAADLRSMQALRVAHGTAAGVRHELRAVRVVRADPRHARLQVTDRMPAYRILDAAGATSRTVPARADRVFDLDLVVTDRGWRIAAITATARPR
jgi:hypothetical protein